MNDEVKILAKKTLWFIVMIVAISLGLVVGGIIDGLAFVLITLMLGVTGYGLIIIKYHMSL